MSYRISAARSVGVDGDPAAPLGGRVAPQVAVVGAGVVGAAIALALQKRGARVTLIDREEPGHGCSYGNSGAISPGSIAPMAMPGVLASVPGMLFDAEGPLYLPAAYFLRALPWLARFVASARPDRVSASATALAALHANAIENHLALAREIGVPELVVCQGHLHLYPNKAVLAKDAAAWRMREAHGFRCEQLDRDGILALEPKVGERYRTGVFLADHATIVNPFRYVQAMVRAFVSRGGSLHRDEVQALSARPDGRWHLTSSQACDTTKPAFDHVVVAAGAWSRRLLDPLGVRLALESQRGYHVQFHGARETMSRTVVLADRKVFVTPMEDGLRVGGTVEIGGLERPPDMHRAAVLERIARETFSGLEGLPSTPWMGHRPCMPDSVPVIGPVAGRPGLWLAVGHGHLGLTDSVNTAQRIADGLMGTATVT